MNAAGLKWLADEIKLAKEEFKAFQLADLGYATSAIAADKKQAYADSDAAYKANKDSAIAVQKAEYTASEDQYELAKEADQIVQINYNERLDAALTAAIADESAFKSLITGVATAELKAEDSDAAARAGQIPFIAAADALVAIAAAIKGASDNNKASAQKIQTLQNQSASNFGADAKVVPEKVPNAFWQFLFTTPMLDPATNFFCGMGDALTWGGTKAIRQNFQVDMVNYDSGAYMGGSIVGGIVQDMILGNLAGGCGRATSAAQAIARVINKADAYQGLGEVAMKWGSGHFDWSDLLVVASSAGRLRGGCFVIDTPVAVGWNYEPIIVRQAFEPDTTADRTVPIDPVTAEDGSINVGWMLTGVGLVVTTVYLRNKRDEEERQKELSRRLIFANGKFVDDFEEDEGESNFPPLGRGGQGGSLGLPACPQLSNNDHNPPLAAESDRGNNQLPGFSAMPTTTTISRSEAADTSTDSLDQRVITRHPTGGLTPSARQTKIRNLLWCFPLLLAGLCFWKGLPSAQHATQTNAVAATKAPAVKSLPPAQQAAHTTKRTLVTRPIQEIRPGHRVIAKNPELADQDVPEIEIDPETTCLVSLHLVKSDGDEVSIDTLVPLDEIIAVAVDKLYVEASSISQIGKPPRLVGSEQELSLNKNLVGCVIEVNVPELGVEGPAEITAVNPCPPIERDDGIGRRLVTSIFRHSAANVVDLQTSDSDDSIGVTANHSFWSEDRKEFVPAGDLRPFENLRRADGTLAQVTRISPRRGPPVPVYNFEVNGQHVYSVGVNGLLVHNACGGAGPVKAGRAAEAALGILSAGKMMFKTAAGKLRIPDLLTKKVLLEVKYVKVLNATKQIMDYANEAKKRGVDFIVVVRQRTHISEGIKALERAGKLTIIKYFY